MRTPSRFAGARSSRSLGLALVALGATGCEELAEKIVPTQELVFVSSGVLLGVEGVNGPTKMEWVFSAEDRIGEWGDWPLPLAPAEVIRKEGETLTIKLLDPELTPGCGVTYGGLKGARLEVTVQSSEVLYLNDGPEAVDLPFACSADVANAVGLRGGRALARDPELYDRISKSVRKLRRRYPNPAQLPPQVHLLVQGQVPTFSPGAKLTWRSGAPAGEVGERPLQFGAFGTTQTTDGRSCVRDRVGIWPKKKAKRGKHKEQLSDSLIELCVDPKHYHAPGTYRGEHEDGEVQRGVPKPKGTRPH